MWKAFSRYVKDPLERKLALKKKKKETVENNAANNKKTCGQFWPKYLCANENEQCRQQTDRNGTWKDARFIRDQNFWIEAAGLGGAFGVGWSISQNFYCKQREVISKKWHGYHRRFSLLRYLLSKQVLLAQPEGEILKELKSDVTSDQEVCQYGPQTAKEAIGEAAEGLISAHNDAIAEMEYRTGMRLMNKKRYRKAVTHFSAASTLHNASAMYHLARCYELGLGTKQDFKKAAQYYRTASKMGHAESLFNLGLFYAYGWGGLPLSSEKARTLFKKAAELDQPEAKAIIDLENKQPPSLCQLENLYFEADKIVVNECCNHNDISYVTEAVKKLSSLGYDEYMKEYGYNKYYTSGSSLDDSTGYSTSSSTSDPLSVYSDFNSFSSSSTDSQPARSSVVNFSGIRRENKLGVKQYKSKVVHRNANAANSGHSEALFNLASCYEATLPPDGDPYQASLLIELYKIAARHGNEYAEERLKTLEVYHTLGILTDYLKKNKLSH